MKACRKCGEEKPLEEFYKAGNQGGRMRSITKTVTTTYAPEWIKIDFTTYSPEFRRDRKGMRRKVNRCFACGHPFKDGETMALGSFGRHGNKALCQTCGRDLLDSEKKEGA